MDEETPPRVHITMDSPWMGVVYKVVQTANIEADIYNCHPDWVASWEWLKQWNTDKGKHRLPHTCFPQSTDP